MLRQSHIYKLSLYCAFVKIHPFPVAESSFINIINYSYVAVIWSRYLIKNTQICCKVGDSMLWLEYSISYNHIGKISQAHSKNDDTFQDCRYSTNVTEFAKRGLIYASNFSNLRLCNSACVRPTVLKIGNRTILSLHL